MRWWTWLMSRFRKPSEPDPERVGKELVQVEQKIEVTEAAKAQAEHAAEITGEVEIFLPMIEKKARDLDFLRAQRDVLLRHRHQHYPEAR
jgi:hypothetical protein